MSKYSRERENFLTKAEYRKALLLSNFKTQYDNAILAEQSLDSLSEKPFTSSVNGILKFCKQVPDIDLVECGDIKITGIQQLKMLCDGRKVLCVIQPNANFFGFSFRMNLWISKEKSMQILSELLGKEIRYYVSGKDVICYIY